MGFRKSKEPPKGSLRKGKFFALPFENERIQNISSGGHYYIFFKKEETLTKFEIHSDFELSLSGEKYNSMDLDEDFMDFLSISFIGKKVLNARTDKFGNLDIYIEGNVKIFIADGPFENWHYTNQSKQIYLHGGCSHFC